MYGKTSKGRWILFSLMACGFCGGPFVSGATLTGTFTDIPQGAVVNLTVEGPLDWVHWGLVTESSVDRKAGVTPVIPDFKPLGLNGPYPYGDNFNSYSWSDGTPTANVVSTTTGVWMYGRTNGFEIEVPADTKQTTLKVYVGTFAAVGNFEATLSGTGLKYTNASRSNMSNGPGGCYALNFSGDSPGQTLVVKYTVGRTFAADGNVTLQAAALTAPGANNPPAVSIANPTDGANFSAHDNIRIAADAADADGTIVKVEFFQNGARLGESVTS